MVRTVVAIENPKASAAVCSALERCGIRVRFRCRTGAETIRAVRKMGGGTVVCSFILPDMSANELGDSLRDCASVLVAAKPQYLDLCEGANVSGLPLPAAPSELKAAMDRLLSEDEHRAAASIPKRGAEEQKTIDLAKALLMQSDGLTESEAHRYLQHKSMDGGIQMAQAAQEVIASIERRRRDRV